MKVLCDSFGLLQLVKEPTREQYLLDLFISDVPECRITVQPYIADHKAVLAEVPMPQVSQKTVCRYSWKLNEADWVGLEKELQGIIRFEEFVRISASLFPIFHVVCGSCLPYTFDTHVFSS